MTALYLTEDEVNELMDMETAVEVVEDAFRAFAEGKAENVPRARAKADGIMLHTMSAGAAYLGLVGWKAYTTTSKGARFHVAVYDAESGAMVALIEGDRLGQLRTGAASGVATEFMARPDAKIVGVLGSGWQARAQLKAVCTVRKIERAVVYSRNEERRNEFANEMSEWCAIPVEPVHSPDAATRERDIVITATSSRAPVLDGNVLDEGTHINAIGSNFLNKAELDIDTVRRADIIVCDSIAQCQLEAGDFSAALTNGITDWRLMHELSDVVADRKTGRATPEQITLFKSVGLAIEDVAMAARIVERAREAGLGTDLPI